MLTQDTADNPMTTLRLFRVHTIQALLIALSNLPPSKPKQLEAALCNALKCIASSCSAVLGRSDWGLCEQYPEAEREEARRALECLLQVSPFDSAGSLKLTTSPRSWNR